MRGATDVDAQKEWLLDLVDPSEVVVVVLGGGRGTRLYPLTRDRAKPAVGFGGKYRLIDITLTNCLRSRFERVFILTQFNSFSLNRHIWQTYSHRTQRDSFIDVVAAEQTTDSGEWFQGTADAVRQSLRYILYHGPRHVLVLYADEIYAMDYRALLLWHQSRGADVTVAGRYTTEEEVGSRDVILVGSDLRVAGFHQKPSGSAQVDRLGLDHARGLRYPPGKPFLCQMGVFLFDTDALVEAVENSDHDFGRGVIPQVAAERQMSCFPFDGYWEDVGTVRAFYQANMAWRAGGGIAKVFQPDSPIITHSRQLPPSRIDGAAVTESIVADGCDIRAQSIARSIVGVRSRIGEGSIVEDAILLGNDAPRAGEPFGIGAHCRIRNAIIDKNVAIGDHTVIENAGGLAETQNDLYAIRSGIVVIPRGTGLPPHTRI
jgi:glucose-1-phosphate adenylyltransferase